MTNLNPIKKPGGYQSLIVYQQAVLIFDLNVEYCCRYLVQIKEARTKDQMEQASRSGKQNIAEGSLEKSQKMNIKLTGVARGSYSELLEDYKDQLRSHKLPIWDKYDPRLEPIRKMRIEPGVTNLSNKSNLSNWTNWLEDRERFCNLMITLISRENYLLDQLIRAQEQKFIKEGGYSENLTRQRLDYRRNNAN